MQTFLERAVRHVYDRHANPPQTIPLKKGGRGLSALPAIPLAGVCVVLPTRRATFFFKQLLAGCSDQPQLGPTVLAIDDFIQEKSGLARIDAMSLLFLAYDVFKEIDPRLDFDRFTTWASTMLADFDRIDQALLDAKAVLGYVSEAKALSRWSPDNPALANAAPAGLLTGKYFELFDHLYRVYAALQARLHATGNAYRGMAYRHLATHAADLLIADVPAANGADAPATNLPADSPTTGPLPAAFYYFIGLNALSAAEEKIITTLVKAQRAQVLWDCDGYYMEQNPTLTAGDTLRRYKASGNFGPWQWQTDHLLTDAKRIRVMGVPNASLQAKVAGQLCSDWLAEQRAQGGEVAYRYDQMTAVVLADEHLLTPLLYSLDESVDQLNITMGLSLKSSALYPLIDALFELQRTAQPEAGQPTGAARRFHFRSVLRVLHHPFIRRYGAVMFAEQLVSGGLHSFDDEDDTPADPNLVRTAAQRITDENRVWLTPEDLNKLGNGHPLFAALFAPWYGKPAHALRSFYQLIDLMRAVYRDRRDAVETEYLFLCYTLCKRLDTLLTERPEAVTMRSFRIFLNELIRQTRMPFSGEPASPLQLMGLLETRALDFRRVIVLSANETRLPVAKRQQSLIPFDACVEFGLPTHGEQEATTAYHFYRLLQRAQEVVLLHVLPSDTYGGKEKSRFIHQLENELARQNPRIRLTHERVTVAEPPEEPTEAARQAADLRIRKTDRTLDLLRATISEKGLYPSHLNHFMQCSLKYYFSRLARLGENKAMDENLAADKFGTWIHATLEHLDADLKGDDGLVTRPDLEAIRDSMPARLDREFVKEYGGYERTGRNHLLFEVAKNILTRFVDKQLAEDNFPVEILALEKLLEVTFVAQVNGRAVPVKIAGRVDRLERRGNQLRLIDYKTGKVEAKDLEVKPATLADTLLNDPRADKVRQLWLYKYLLAKLLVENGGLPLSPDPFNDNAHFVPRTEDLKLVAGIYSFRNIDAGLLESNLFFESGDESPETFVRHSEQYLATIVARLLDPDVPFEKTTNLETCNFCPYRGICAR